VSGHAAIRPRYETLFAGFNPAIEGRLDAVCVSGAMATVTGHNGGRMVSKTGTPDRALNDTYLMVLARGADGRWRIQHLVWR
jgi:ketosteroid isomerase-like protein